MLNIISKSMVNCATSCGIYSSADPYGNPVNNISCSQHAQLELKEAKTCVVNSCYTLDSVSSISRIPLVFWTCALPVVFSVKTRVNLHQILKKGLPSLSIEPQTF